MLTTEFGYKKHPCDALSPGKSLPIEGQLATG